MEAAELIPLGVFYPSVAVMDERIYLFLARGLTQSASHPDEDEFLHVETRPFGKVVEDILRGSIPDGKTQTAILKAWCLKQEEER